ncbi:MAG: hypothetical protein QOE09_270 [Ilumatobacteraceae bacterium]|jgi:hypothetical protein
MCDVPIANEIVRLIGVYDANGTIRGELAYWFGARLGRRSCALCDITHGVVRERTDWLACRAAFPVEFDTYHRDDQPDSVRAAIGDTLPAVVAETTNGMLVLLGPDDLAACDRSTDKLFDAVQRAVSGRGLSWPA